MKLKLPIGILLLVTYCYCLDCDIIPEDIVKPKNKNDLDRYIISIQGNPKTYTPLQKYNVSLKINPNKLPQKPFKQFFLTLESVDSEEDTQAYRPTGQFELEVSAQISMRFSDFCENTVIENSKMPKWEIQVHWIAPPAGSGCVAIKATVVENRENWFSEDGQLTKILCEDSQVDENVKPPLVDKCCACSEAKYEVAFEGRWTRNTHPRNYPTNIWATKFSDIIGASHRKYHSFWNEQDYASEGLKELAEEGKTHRLESEIKAMGNNIRTIIKARGLQHPNITDTTYAVFRVDSNNHLVSLVTKITPSPDWFVGVSNFELCKSDCTWAESYTYNLYPMDGGTDDGLGYLSSEPLRFSHKVITPISQNSPNDPQSPFFDEDGNPMNPIAKVHFTRQRLYNTNKACNGKENSGSNEDDDCATTKWGDWTPCSVPCGLGRKTRMRTYVDPKKAQDCFVRLVQHQTCKGTAKYCKNSQYKKFEDSIEEIEEELSESYERQHSEEVKDTEKDSTESNNEDEKSEEKTDEENSEEKTTAEEEEEKSDENEQNQSTENSDCAVTEWSDWSSCSATCGRGTKTRDRKLINPDNEEQCKDVELQENASCRGPIRKCEDEGESKCTNTNWGPWSSCSVSCGTGVKRRLRLPSNSAQDKVSNEDNEETKVDAEEENCSTSEMVKCYIDCPESDKVGESLIVEQRADGKVKNCKVSEWSIWSKCEIQRRGQTCGTGSKKRSRQILRHPENGGRACPRKLIQRKSCTIDCNLSEENTRVEKNSAPQCIMSDWTDFTPCSSNCGSSAMQLKTRKILYKPPGAVCPSRVMYKPCNLPLACTSDGTPIYL